jgi:Activator of Hsp90 ATPase homolog 1-like protein
MDDTQLVVKGERALTAAQFHALTEVPPEIEWFANITNPRTRVAYEVDVKAFARFVGIRSPEECRSVTMMLSRVENGTRLRLVHSGFVTPKNDTAFKNMSEGWKKVVQSIGGIAGEED